MNLIPSLKWFWKKLKRKFRKRGKPSPGTVNLGINLIHPEDAARRIS